MRGNTVRAIVGAMLGLVVVGCAKTPEQLFQEYTSIYDAADKKYDELIAVKNYAAAADLHKNLPTEFIPLGFYAETVVPRYRKFIHRCLEARVLSGDLSGAVSDAWFREGGGYRRSWYELDYSGWTADMYLKANLPWRALASVDETIDVLARSHPLSETEYTFEYTDAIQRMYRKRAEIYQTLGNPEAARQDIETARGMQVRRDREYAEWKQERREERAARREEAELRQQREDAAFDAGMAALRQMNASMRAPSAGATWAPTASPVLPRHSAATGAPPGPAQTLPPASRPRAYDGDGSLRSLYQHEAESYEWAAREYAAQGESAQAEQARANARAARAKASELDSNTRTFGGPRK